MKWLLLLIAMALLTACAPMPIVEPRPVPPPMRIVGYNDMDEMLGALMRAYTQSHPGETFELVLKSTRSGPPALIDGTASLVPMGAAFTPADRAAYRARYGDDPVAVRVAHDSLTPNALSSPTGVFVHRDNPLRTITLDQLRRSFADRPAGSPTRHWGQLGLTGAWADRPVHLVGLGETTAIGQFMLNGVLRSGRFVEGYRGLSQSREVARLVAEDPLALGIANLSHAGPAIRALALRGDNGRLSPPTEREVRSGRYPLDRFLLIYVRRERDGHIDSRVGRVLAFILSDIGQTIIAGGSRGYLPLNSAERRIEKGKLAKSNN